MLYWSLEFPMLFTFILLHVSCCCIGTLPAHPIPWFRQEAVAGADPLPEPWSLLDELGMTGWVGQIWSWPSWIWEKTQALILEAMVWNATINRSWIINHSTNVLCPDFPKQSTIGKMNTEAATRSQALHMWQSCPNVLRNIQNTCHCHWNLGHSRGSDDISVWTKNLF